MPHLSALLDSADFVALNICRTAAGWQASLERSRGSFSIRVAETPSEAVAEVLGMVPLPPLPPMPPMPPCPVALPA